MSDAVAMDTSADGDQTTNTEPQDEEVAKLGAIAGVTMHPLVLLSAADHYHRVARGTRKRVVGVLLGTVFKGQVDCTNSFAVPFEEDSKNPVSVFFFCSSHLLRSCITQEV